MTHDALKLLIIDDEPQIRRLVRNAVKADPDLAGVRTDGEALAVGVQVLEAGTGQEGIEQAAAQQPGLVVLDLGLPDMDGIRVCREIRRWSQAPIVVLSARHADQEKATLLDAGADDFITKPFSTVELMARLRAQFRRLRATSRPGSATASRVTFGGITVDTYLRRVERGDELVHVTPTEWALLRTLVTHPRQTLTHRSLFHAVWGNAEGDAQQYLRVYVAHLRRKIEQDPVRPRFIHTEVGVGYRFEPDGASS